MDKAHRRDLKHDKFADQVGHGIEYASDHRSQVVKWGSIGLAAAVVIFGAYFYFDQQASNRAKDLTAAMRVQEAQIGAPNASEYVLSYPTPAEKTAATIKAFTSVMDKYPSKREGLIARFYLGVISADQGKLAEAESMWKPIAESGDAEYASQAKLSLGQLYETQGRTPDAEKMLRSVIDHPTILVSKEQGTIALAHALARTKPEEARKLLEPLRTERAAISRTALTAIGELPQK